MYRSPTIIAQKITCYKRVKNIEFAVDFFFFSMAMSSEEQSAKYNIKNSRVSSMKETLWHPNQLFFSRKKLVCFCQYFSKKKKKTLPNCLNSDLMLCPFLCIASNKENKHVCHPIIPPTLILPAMNRKTEIISYFFCYQTGLNPRAGSVSLGSEWESSQAKRLKDVSIWELQKHPKACEEPRKVLG